MRTRLESTGQLTGTVTKPQASAGERAAVARLLNRPVRAGQSASVSLDTLDEVLRRSGAWPDGLASAVVALTGTVVDPAWRAGERDAWQAAANTLRRLGRPELSGWADRVIRTGALRRAAPTASSAQALAAQLATVAGALPTSGESLGGFAARTLHDAHALDAHTPLGTLAVGLAGALGAALAPAPGPGITSTAAEPVATTTDALRGGASPAPISAPISATTDASADSARWRRDAWQSVGVVLDELSSSVLALGLPGGDQSPTSRALAALAAGGQPVVLTLRQLLADDLGVVPPIVYVCESPAVVAAAADALGPESAPLVCLNGQPGAAAILLLEALVAQGAELRYHGDFDWSGIGVARALTERVTWVPWRFAAEDYSAACAELTGLPPLLVPPGISAESVETPWDADLAEAMASVALAVDEDLLLSGLLADLAG